MVIGSILVRIIPACAGSTAAEREGGDARWDHPRMRGEHKLAVIVPFSDQGSSPHARGARRCVPGWDGMEGIIPACAGSTR